MYKLYSVFVLSAHPHVLEFQSVDCREFKRTNPTALVYIAPLEVRLAEDGETVTSTTGHRVGRLEEWSECSGIRVFWSDDLGSICLASEEVHEPKAA